MRPVPGRGQSNPAKESFREGGWRHLEHFVDENPGTVVVRRSLLGGPEKPASASFQQEEGTCRSSCRELFRGAQTARRPARHRLRRGRSLLVGTARMGLEGSVWPLGPV